MTPAQIETLLTPWLDHWRTLDGTFEAQAVSHGADPEAPFWKAVYSLFDAYTDQLATQVGDTHGWLHWFIYDNDAGARELYIAVPHRTRKRTKSTCIRTLKDLSHLLATPDKQAAEFEKAKAAFFACSDNFDARGSAKALKKLSRLHLKHRA